MLSNNSVFPADLIPFLQSRVDHFQSEPLRRQTALAWIIWCWGVSKKYRHSELDGWNSLYCRSRDELFGRGGFQAMVERCRPQLFEITPGWNHRKHLTKGYRFTGAAEDLVIDYLNQRRQIETDLADNTGRHLRKRRNSAIAHRDANGQYVKTEIRLNFDIPINLDAIHCGLDLLKAWKDHYFYGMPRPSDKRFRAVLDVPPDKVEEWLDRRMQQLLQLERLAYSTILPRGHIPQTYVESDAGRLYGTGVSLQNACREVKSLALAGCWEYDFSNCHYSIFAQLCERAGFDCPAIRNYMANTRQVRQQLANDLELSIKAVKVCLLALMYGAKTSTWHENAIPKAIGTDKAAELYQHPLFKALAQEIEQGRKVMIAAATTKRSRAGLVVMNEMGKGIKADAGEKEITAHLLQGVEAKMLGIAIRGKSADVVLIQHDGWTATKEMDPAEISQAIKAETSIHMHLEGAKLNPI